MASQGSEHELDKRQQSLLVAIVTEYIQRAQPVSSQRLERNYSLGVKSATLRSMMAELEQWGYLYQPHTSAGRIPTEKAFRQYVNMLKPQPYLGKAEREKIELHCSDQSTDPNERIRQTTRLLSALTGHPAVATGPRFDTTAIQRIEFVRIRPNQVAAILVSSAPKVRDRVLGSERDYTQDELNQMASFLTRLVSGCSLEQAAGRIARVKKQKGKVDDSLAQVALSLGEELLSDQEPTSIYVEGTAKLLNQTDVSDLSKARDILEVLEDRVALADALNELVKYNTPNVAIGSENSDTRLSEFSVVAAAYTSGAVKVGSLAVIGPLRMNYSRIIPLVEYTAQTLSRAWN